MSILKLLSKLNQISQIYFALEQAEIEIRAAVPGEVVICPTVKGLRLWGRTIELPLQPRIVD